MSELTNPPRPNPIMVRMDHSMRADLIQVARANGLTMSDIIRIACTRQLPALKSGHTTLAKPEKKPA